MIRYFATVPIYIYYIIYYMLYVYRVYIPILLYRVLDTIGILFVHMYNNIIYRVYNKYSVYIHNMSVF